jgi:hypothetical protein
MITHWLEGITLQKWDFRLDRSVHVHLFLRVFDVFDQSLFRRFDQPRFHLA